MVKFIRRMFAKARLKDNALEKQLASINKEPWVKVLEVKMQDPNDPRTGYFELDWNDSFVASLSEAGYSGRNDDEVVEQWFNDLCRGVVSNESSVL
jgi:hypothetical protein